MFEPLSPILMELLGIKLCLGVGVEVGLLDLPQADLRAQNECVSGMEYSSHVSWALCGSMFYGRLGGYFTSEIGCDGPPGHQIVSGCVL